MDGPARAVDRAPAVAATAPRKTMPMTNPLASFLLPTLLALAATSIVAPGQDKPAATPKDAAPKDAAPKDKDAAKAAPKAEYRDGRLDAFYIGHSLAADIPDVVAGCFAAAKERGGKLDFRFREQHKIGASLASQFGEAEKPESARCPQEPTFGGTWSDEFAKGEWDALVLIDSVPREIGEMPETLDHATRFAKALATKSPKARVFVYEPWHCIHSGTDTPCMYDRGPTMKLPWRQRLVADAPMWDKLVADLQKAVPSARPALIPSGRALGMLVEAAEAGTVDGFTALKDFFDDDIHLSVYGKYFVGLVHYAALSGQSPVGLSTVIRKRWGAALFDEVDHQGKVHKAPSPAAALRMQEIAWAAVQGKPDPGAGKAKKKATGK
jgi:hypothetical protein